MKPLLTALLLVLLGAPAAFAADLGYPLDAPAPDGRRPGGTLAESRPAPPLAAEENKDLKRERNYPEQPPTIPHSIVGYRIDKDSNKCLSCHSRANSARTQAVMISITHYMDRDGQPLAAVSPRRYFCVQCHVPQQDVKPLVDNRFENIDQILEKKPPMRRANPEGGRMKALIAWLAGYWRVLRRPSVHFSLGFLTLGGFIAGIVFWGGFNTALEATNTETFCISCHEMRDNVFVELKDTIHYSNRSGVRATCPDCHVPHKWTDKIARKMQASKEVWARSSAPSTPARNSSTTAASWPSTNGRGSRPTIRWNAATATTSSSWTSPGRACARGRCTPPPWPAAKPPASTATRGSPTTCRT